MEDNNVEIKQLSILNRIFIIAKILWPNRFQVLRVTVGCTVLAIGIVLLLPVKYKAQTVILPPKSSVPNGWMGNLAEMAGIGNSNTYDAELYPQILQSDRILDSLILYRYNSVNGQNLFEVFEIDGDSQNEKLIKTRKKLKDLINISFDIKTRVVTVEVLMPTPALAVEVAENLNKFLDIYLREINKNSAGQEVSWLEGRIKQVTDTLEFHSQRYADFKKKNRIIEESPELQIKEMELRRQLTIHTEILIELKKRKEVAFLASIKNTDIVNILDHPTLPYKKASPQRTVIVIAVFFLSFVIISAYYVLTSLYYSKIVEIKNELRSIIN